MNFISAEVGFLQDGYPFRGCLYVLSVGVPVPEGQSIIAHRFMGGFRYEYTSSPGGTADLIIADPSSL